MLCYICSKSSQSQDLLLFFETKNYVTTLTKLLKLTTISILDKLSTSLICSDCKDKLEQAEWIFKEIEQLQGRLNSIKNQVELDLVKNRGFWPQKDLFTGDGDGAEDNDSIDLLKNTVESTGHQLLDNELLVVKPEPFNYVDYGDDLDMDVSSPGESRDYFEEFNLKNCQVVLERDKELLPKLLPPSTSKSLSFVNKEIQYKPKKGEIICRFCSKDCKTTRSLKVHIRSHTGEKPYKCNHCSTSFASSTSLNGHVINVHKIGSRVVKCQSCDFTGDQYRVRRHAITHSKDKSVKCEFSTNRKSSSNQKHLDLGDKESFADMFQISSRLHSSTNIQQEKRTKLVRDKPLKSGTKCPYCSKDCKTTRALKVHTRSHTGEKPYKCNHCSTSFASSTSLNGHVINVHKIGSRVVKCQSCDFTGDQYRVRRHAVIHSKDKSLKCEFSTKKSLLEHHRNLKHLDLGDKVSFMFQTSSRPHSTNIQQEKRTKLVRGKTLKGGTICPYCSKDCKTTRALKVHIRSHTGEKPYKCTHCNTSFASSTSLNGHVINVHKIGSRVVKCEFCDFTGDQYRVRRHAVIHSIEKKLQCEFCEYSTNLKRSLEYHRNHKHLGHKGSFLCQICSRLLSSNIQLQKHIRLVHERELCHFCSSCGKGFINEVKLKRHEELTHTNKNKPESYFVCDQCPKTYSSSRSLSHHISVRHTEGERFKCKICSKLFLEQRSLDNHMRLHKPDDQNLHECQYCGESYILKKSLSQHIRVRHLNPERFLHSDPTKRKKFVRRKKVPIVKDTETS